MTVTCGMYAYQAKEHQLLAQSPGFARYLAIDKSPQGGRDWLMATETCIAVADLRNARRDAAQLVALA